jgi:hypothetical protein
MISKCDVGNKILVEISDLIDGLIFV